MDKLDWSDVIALNLDRGVILAKAKPKNKDSASTPSPLSAIRRLETQKLRSKFDEACKSYEAKRAVSVEMVAVPAEMIAVSVEMVTVPVEMVAVPAGIKEPTLITCLMELCKLETVRLPDSIQT